MGQDRIGGRMMDERYGEGKNREENNSMKRSEWWDRGRREKGGRR